MDSQALENDTILVDSSTLQGIAQGASEFDYSLIDPALYVINLLL